MELAEDGMTLTQRGYTASDPDGGNTLTEKSFLREDGVPFHFLLY